MTAALKTDMGFTRYRIQHVLNRIARRPLADDFYWDDYNIHYRSELQENQKHHTLQIAPGDFAFVGGALEAKREINPLHPNHRLLYETIVQLRPAAVVELGCGGGDHLHNLHVLAPEIELHGIDRDPKQLAFLRERYPDLGADLRIADATLPLPAAIDQVDLSYTQAVIMHLHDGNGHRVALANAFRLARKHVVLMEDWRRHAYVDDLYDLHERGIIDWPELHLYYREAPELRRPHILIASKGVLEYPVLDDFAILRDSAS
jgi:hypothetical protein